MASLYFKSQSSRASALPAPEEITHGIATSNQRPNINSSLKALGVTNDTVVVERGDVARAKPKPNLFLECHERLGVEAKDCYVISDAVWDLMAARRVSWFSAVSQA